MSIRPLSAQELLAAWEQGLFRHPIQRALILLAMACPDMSPTALAELSIGQRDGYLLTLREWAFGPQLVSLATCPACAEQLELTFAASDVRARPDTEPGASLAVVTEGYEINFRLPNSLDLLALAGHPNTANAHGHLLERCLLTANHDGEAQAAGQLPEKVVEAITAKMAEADPQADVELALSCPACSHQWNTAFDIVSFFWQEINTWVHRTLYEVHLLASAYSWNEADILAMTPWKRQYYLKMVQG